jgi:pimeloyl-ACP methyl ester carboxylesterase
MTQKSRLQACLSVALLFLVAQAFGPLPSAEAQLPDKFPDGIAPEEQALLRGQISGLQTRISELREKAGPGTERTSDALLFPKAVVWALRYEPSLTAADLTLMKRALDRGVQRADSIASGKLPWEQKRGKLVRGYISDVDGSVQPYGLIVPAGYDRAKPMRLDVVLHGSVRPAGLMTLRFLSGFDEGDTGGAGPNANYIELHPLGRVENCYRWAGESDVFEAIEDVCRRYNIDRDRIVLRGMSMGASGTWHLGLKHPDKFVALGPYCGYVDTHQFSETPGMNFVKVGPLPEIQEKMLHMLDSVDYAANAGVVPEIAAIGDKDPFFQAHVIMGAAKRREGLEMVNLISPGTGHVQDPATWKEQMRQIGVYADRGLNHTPRHIRFVTWTLKYASCHWIELLKLKNHYERSEIDATISSNGDIVIKEPLNITRFAISPVVLESPTARIIVGGQAVALPRVAAFHRAPVDLVDAVNLADELAPTERRPPAVTGSQLASASISDPLIPSTSHESPHHLITPDPRSLMIERRGQRWVYAGRLDKARLTGKRPGLQGPIDDAFTDRFLCVRGTGKPWNPAVQAWADASLRRFAYEWSRYFVGDLPVKDDTAVTPEDCRRCNLILFGDPGSNSWIRKALPSMPLRWTRESVVIGTAQYNASDTAPAVICPSPFPVKGLAPRYVVLNSGHTFHEAELNRLNYLLFPRLGDWAVFTVGAGQPTDPSAELKETIVKSGFLDEDWKFGQ